MRILGIDLGSTSIKAVELDSAFGRYEIHEYHEQPLAPGEDPTAALNRLVQGLSKTPDRVAVTLRTGQLTFRNLQLPTKDKKAIQASVGFELEDELPFSIEDSIYDYSVLSTTGQTSHVHVAVTLKKYVENLLAQLAGAGVDPDLITTEAWAYRTFLNRVLAQPSQEKPILFLQLGHRVTTLHVQWRGFPVFSRELRWGGQDLTTALSRKFGIAVDQAEKMKLDRGLILAPEQKDQATPEQSEISEALREAAQSLIQELRQAELACKSITRETLGAVYLSGGTSLLPGLAAKLETKLQVPVQLLRSLSSVANSGVTYSEQTDATFVLAAASGLCFVGQNRGSAINFRKGEFSKQGQNRELNMAALRKPLLAVGTVMASLFISLGIQSHVYSSRITEKNSQLEKSIRSFFLGVSNSAIRTYLSNTNTLKTSINKELEKQRETVKLLGPNPHSPLDFLKTLSASVPKDLVVDMTKFQVGAAPTSNFSSKEPPTASLTFLIKDAKNADRLRSLVGNKIGVATTPAPQEVTTADGSKRYQVTFTGKPTEDAYGN